MNFPGQSINDLVREELDENGEEENGVEENGDEDDDGMADGRISNILNQTTKIHSNFSFFQKKTKKLVVH